MYVECHQWSMARSADNWESPSEFRPERFLGNNEKDVLESLQPFGIGKVVLIYLGSQKKLVCGMWPFHANMII